MNPVNNNLSHANLRKLDVETPFLAMDLQRVKLQYDLLKKNLPDFEIFYAVKCNPEQPILETLKRAGSSFEIASIGELDRLLKIGVNADEVIYSNPVKPAGQIITAFKKGVRSFAYDCPEELEKIAQCAPTANVYLRMSVSNSGSLINLANKFGANKTHSVSLLSLAADLGLNPYGLAFHVGSQAEDLALWDKAFEDAFDIMNELERREGIKLKALNIGGGFPVQYINKIPDISAIASKIKSYTSKLPYPVQLWCEPGRFIVAEAGVIATTIIGRTTRHNAPWVFVDAGRFQCFVEMFESDDLQYPIFTAPEGYFRKAPYTITGPSCDSYDTISRNVELPCNLAVGDRVYFASAGAYTHVYGAPFNDFKVPSVVYV